jgi:adenosylcobinamide-phosphate synthase
MAIFIAFAALLVERLFGYPGAVYRAIGHPVTWIGALIARLDARWNRAEEGPDKRRAAGVTALAVIVLLPAGLAVFASGMLDGSVVGVAILALLASSLLAQRSLEDHVAAVAAALETEGLDGGRRAVSMIVGRDPQALDEAGVSRAAIESLAENFSDGVVAPAFWLGLLGLAGGVAYKAANTADSMIGHKSERHLDFGRAAARFDDFINLPASRLSALLLWGAAWFVPGASPERAREAVRRDARKHRSPNAGWPEAAMAGALGLALAGPRVYAGVTVEDGFMGEGGRREATASDIRRALALYRAADTLLIALFGALAIILWRLW